MALSLNSRCLHMPCRRPSTPSNTRIILLLRSDMALQKQWQGLLSSRQNGTFPELPDLSFKLCQTDTWRRLRVRCLMDHGPESEGNGKNESSGFIIGSYKRMATSPKSALSVTRVVFFRIVKTLLAMVILLSLVIAGAPAFLSTRFGHDMMIGLVNKAIPGNIDIQSLSLGWSKPVCVKGVSLKGIDGNVVVSIVKLETKASLFSLVRGKSGLGDCTIVCPIIDLQEDRERGLLKLALALIPATKFDLPRKASSCSTKGRISPLDIALAANVQAPGGGLKLVDGKLMVRDDVAATLGQRVFINVLLGSWAVDDDAELQQACEGHPNTVPFKAGMWSEGTQGEALGFIHIRKQLIDLLQPVKLEMDLSPAVAQVYLARINPLLGEVVGPAVQDEDMPDVVLYISPDQMRFPSEAFKVKLEPMKAVLARGPLAGGILGLLSTGKEDIAKGRKEVTVQTSRIQSHVSMDGNVECSRIDFLIAGKVAVATWGSLNWKSEALKMTIAVLSSTLSNLFGLKIAEDYCLKIPVGGTVEHPQVDWKAAALGVAQLSLTQRGGKFFRDLASLFESNDSVPDPVDVVPWISKS